MVVVAVQVSSVAPSGIGFSGGLYVSSLQGATTESADVIGVGGTVPPSLVTQRASHETPTEQRSAITNPQRGRRTRSLLGCHAPGCFVCTEQRSYLNRGRITSENPEHDKLK